MSELDEKLASIARFAAEQKARVSSVSVDGVSFSLAPDEQPVVDATATVTEQPRSPLEDPSMYGLAEGSKLPGFTDPRKVKSS